MNTRRLRELPANILHLFSFRIPVMSRYWCRVHHRLCHRFLQALALQDVFPLPRPPPEARAKETLSMWAYTGVNLQPTCVHPIASVPSTMRGLPGFPPPATIGATFPSPAVIRSNKFMILVPVVHPRKTCDTTDEEPQESAGAPTSPSMMMPMAVPMVGMEHARMASSPVKWKRSHQCRVRK